MNLTNLQRDSNFTKLIAADTLNWSGGTPILDTFYLNNSDPIVYDKFGAAQSKQDVQTFVTADTFKGIGCNIAPPNLDAVPYRVKAYAASLDPGYRFWLGVGYALATIVGFNDQVDEPYYFPFTGSFDDILMIPAIDEANPLFGRPINFAILAADPLAGVGTTNIFGHLSVQNLSVSPPAFAQSTS